MSGSSGQKTCHTQLVSTSAGNLFSLLLIVIEWTSNSLNLIDLILVMNKIYGNIFHFIILSSVRLIAEKYCAHLVPLRHEELEVGAWQAQLEICLHKAQIRRIAVQAVHAHHKMQTLWREHAVLFADMEVRQSRC